MFFMVLLILIILIRFLFTKKMLHFFKAKLRLLDLGHLPKVLERVRLLPMRILKRVLVVWVLKVLELLLNWGQLMNGLIFLDGGLIEFYGVRSFIQPKLIWLFLRGVSNTPPPPKRVVHLIRVLEKSRSVVANSVGDHIVVGHLIERDGLDRVAKIAIIWILS